ncbi:MAG: hypothetical protein EZS28_041621, partial [Streblomastix strix]
ANANANVNVIQTTTALNANANINANQITNGNLILNQAQLVNTVNQALGTNDNQPGNANNANINGQNANVNVQTPVHQHNLNIPQSTPPSTSPQIASLISANILHNNVKITKGCVTVTVKVHIPRPNRYSFGVLLDLPAQYNVGFAYKTGVMGYGLHDHTGSLGIFCQTQLVAPSSLGYATNDLVTMTVDVDRGNLIYKVNGVKCAELLSCELIKRGVYIAATLYNKGASWTIISK